MRAIIILIFIAGFTSCKKHQECYDCQTTQKDTTFCEGSLEWQMIDDGHVITDNGGENYSCH